MVCDTCQQVCPKNRGINTQHDDIVLEPEILKPRLVPLLQMSNKEFKNTYGHLAGAWRGKTYTKKRNSSFSAF